MRLGKKGGFPRSPSQLQLVIQRLRRFEKTLGSLMLHWKCTEYYHAILPLIYFIQWITHRDKSSRLHAHMHTLAIKKIKKKIIISACGTTTVRTAPLTC